MKKQFYLLIMALLLAACGEKPVTKAQSAVENSKDLVVVTPWEITSLDPSKSGYIFQRMQLAETLVDVLADGTLIGGLAEVWQHNGKATVWTFMLRPSVKFHDGSLLRAEDVVKSLTVALTKPTVLKSTLIEKITALDEHTVQITLQKGLISFPAYLAHSTAIILSQSSFDSQNKVERIIGTGPYQATKIEAPQKIEQVAFADYWGEKAKITQVSYLANSRSETRTLLAQSNPNYLVFNLDPASTQRLQQDPNLQVRSKSIARTIQYKVNGAHPLFSDVRIRQLLSQAIDRKGIAESVLRIENGIAEELFPSAFADWRLNVSTEQPDYTEIKAGFMALGFHEDAQGMLHKDGKPFSFTLKTYSDRPELPIIATALQNQWRQVGIDVKVSVSNFSDIPAGHQDGSLEMALYGRNYGMIPDPMGALLTDFAPEGGDWGVMNWKNAALNQALNELQVTLNKEKQRALKQRIANIIYTERPITPIVFYQQNVAAHKTLQGLNIDPFERNFGLNKLSWRQN